MRRIALLATLAVVALVLACDGGEESPPTATPAPSSSGTPAAPRTTMPSPPATQAPTGPAQPVVLEEGAPVTEGGSYVVEVSTGRVWWLHDQGGLWSPDGKALVSSGCCIDKGGLDFIDIATGQVARLYDGDVKGAAWSPDGTQIAFSRHGRGAEGPKGLYVINRDGSGLKQLSESGAYALEWSPGGDHIAFSVWLDHLYVLEVESGQTTDLTDVGGHALAWSPSGTELAFTNDSGLYVYDADTGERRQVAVGPSEGPILWSPDGSRIAFRFGPRVAPTRGPDANNPNAGARMFHLVEVEGSTEPEPLSTARSPSWSPDGTKIAYLSEGCITGDWDIYIADRDGGSPVRLTGTPETFKEGPFWSPTRAVIAFITDNSDDLMLLNAESGELQTLASGGPQSGGPGIHLHDPPWSPDGRYIMFRAGGAHGICD